MIKTSSSETHVTLEETSAQFSFELAIFEDMTFTSPVPADYIFNVPENIYVGVTSDAPVDRFYLAVDNCYFTSEPNQKATIRHQLLQNGCPTQEVKSHQKITKIAYII